MDLLPLGVVLCQNNNPIKKSGSHYHHTLLFRYNISHNKNVVSSNSRKVLSANYKSSKTTGHNNHNNGKKKPAVAAAIAISSVVIVIIRQLFLVEDAKYAIAALEGPSMMPTILPRNGFYLVENNRLSIIQRNGNNSNDNDNTNDMIQRGAVVVCIDPRSSVENEKGNENEQQRFICKRVVALPGDIVHVYHHYSTTEINSNKQYYDTHNIPKGFIWLEGDNPTWSIDSRSYGAVKSDLVVGQVLAQVWPITKSPFISNVAQVQSHSNSFMNRIPSGSESPCHSKVFVAGAS